MAKAARRKLSGDAIDLQARSSPREGWKREQGRRLRFQGYCWDGVGQSQRRKPADRRHRVRLRH